MDMGARGEANKWSKNLSIGKISSVSIAKWLNFFSSRMAFWWSNKIFPSRLLSPKTVKWKSLACGVSNIIELYMELRLFNFVAQISLRGGNFSIKPFNFIPTFTGHSMRKWWSKMIAFLCSRWRFLPLSEFELLKRCSIIYWYNAPWSILTLFIAIIFVLKNISEERNFKHVPHILMHTYMKVKTF